MNKKILCEETSENGIVWIKIFETLDELQVFLYT
jgi:hypothetical protein